MKKRDFLKYLGASSVALPHFLNGFNVKARSSSLFGKAFRPYLTDTDKVLVLVQLNGGNDGLNTVIPLDQFENYFNARENIYIREDKVLPLNGSDHLGLHTRMTGMQQLFNEGKLAVVQNVGYPHPNFSHFRGTDIWQTGADHDEFLNTGWIGRYLKYEYPNYPFDFPNPDMLHPLAIEIGYAQSLTMQGPFFNMGIAIADPTSFYDLVEGADTPLPDTPAGDQVEYVRLIARQSNHYADYIKAAYDNVSFQPQYPDTSLAAQLKIVARLIAGGLQTRVFQVNMGGFDTHDFQVDLDAHWLGHHGDLLEELSEGIKAFMDDLEYHGIGDRVVGMTYSEFGRRILANGSFGTDHGAAAPVFVFGNSVQGGVVGDNPIIPVVATANDNIPMQHDFRSIYTSLMRDWFCVPESGLGEIMLRDFPTLPLIGASDCVATATRSRRQNAGKKLIGNYPNPFTDSTNITFASSGGKAVVQVLNTQGQLVATPFSGAASVGEQTVTWDAGALPAGVYYCRLQNGGTNQVGAMMKVR
ncbi:MAG TPA: DUF1501 domain-containing protein [Bacteroidetes bacterium]|nr:DUF1501 domain-containing protein [Bacteroidota bacterium]